MKRIETFLIPLGVLFALTSFPVQVIGLEPSGGLYMVLLACFCLLFVLVLRGEAGRVQ